MTFNLNKERISREDLEFGSMEDFPPFKNIVISQWKEQFNTSVGKYWRSVFRMNEVERRIFKSKSNKQRNIKHKGNERYMVLLSIAIQAHHVHYIIWSENTFRWTSAHEIWIEKWMSAADQWNARISFSPHMQPFKETLMLIFSLVVFIKQQQHTRNEDEKKTHICMILGLYSANTFLIVW